MEHFHLLFRIELIDGEARCFMVNQIATVSTAFTDVTATRTLDTNRQRSVVAFRASSYVFLL